MAKIKSVKFFDFAGRIGDWISLNVYFYDTNKQLIPMDFSTPISNSLTYCETTLYIVTCDASYDADNYSCRQAFHTGNVNKTVGLKPIGNCYLTPSEGHWIKIEFKTPQNFSDIKILHTYEKEYGFTTCYYEVEHANNKIERNLYISNGKVNIFPREVVRSFKFNQDEYDAQFDSINFLKYDKIYDTKIGYVETLDTNNFRNISKDSIEKLKVLYAMPENSTIHCLVSFDKKQTWKTFNGTSWLTISDTSPENIILNGMSIGTLNQLDKNKLISGGFTGDLDFKIAMKTNDINKTPSVTKIYIEYK